MLIHISVFIDERFVCREVVGGMAAALVVLVIVIVLLLVMLVLLVSRIKGKLVVICMLVSI